MTDISQEEANKLFANVSQAMQADDSDKLSTLLTQETPVEEPAIEDLPADEPEEEVPEVEDDTTDSDQSDEESEEEDKSPEQGDKDKKSDDPLEALRAEIAELRKSQQAVSSQVGRVPSIQRRLADYDKKLAELSKATSSQASEKVKPKIEAALKDLEDTDPALASTLKTIIGETLGGVDGEAHAREIANLQAARDAEYADYVAEQKNILLGKYPNVGEVFNGEHWQAWKKEQPRHIVELATSDDAQAVIMALDLYKADMLKKYPDVNKETVKEEPAVVNEQAAKIEEGRKQQQARAANLSNGKPPARVKEPSDPEALLKKYFEEIQKQNGRT